MQIPRRADDHKTLRLAAALSRARHARGSPEEDARLLELRIAMSELWPPHLLRDAALDRLRRELAEVDRAAREHRRSTAKEI